MLSRRNDPETSRIAEKNHAESGRLKTHRHIVLEAVRMHPGCTPGELQARLSANHVDLDYHEVVRRLSDLGKPGGGAAPGDARICERRGTMARAWYPL